MALAPAVFVAGCAISTTLPASRMEMPETHGEAMALGADLAVEGGHSLEFSDDYTFTPITDSPVPERSSLGYKMGGSLALAKRLDVGVRGGFGSSNMLRAKLQLLGEPRRATRQGNFSLAVTGAVGYDGSRGSGTGFGDSEVDSYALNAYALDGAVIAGYRILDEVLVYGGAFAQWYEIDVTHELDGMRYDYDGNALQSGANLGFGYSIDTGRRTRLDILIEVVYAASETGSNQARNAFLGVRAAGVRF
jgi:hypothetical protein